MDSFISVSYIGRNGIFGLKSIYGFNFIRYYQVALQKCHDHISATTFREILSLHLFPQYTITLIFKINLMVMLGS